MAARCISSCCSVLGILWGCLFRLFNACTLGRKLASPEELPFELDVGPKLGE